MGVRITTIEEASELFEQEESLGVTFEKTDLGGVVFYESPKGLIVFSTFLGALLAGTYAASAFF